MAQELLVKQFALGGRSVDIATSATSATMMTRIIMLAINRVLFTRRLQPADCFIAQEQTFGAGCQLGMIIPVISTDAPFAARLSKIMRGAADAIKRGYLGRLVFVVYETYEKEYVIESYEFKLTYTEEGIQIETLNTDRKMVRLTGGRLMEKVAFDTRHLLDSVDMHINLFEELPAGAHPDIRLVYNRRTPKDYHPPGFVGAPKVLNWAGGTVPNARKLGRTITTEYHTIGVEARTKLNTGKSPVRPPRVLGVPSINGDTDDDQGEETARSYVPAKFTSSSSSGEERARREESEVQSERDVLSGDDRPSEDDGSDATIVKSQPHKKGRRAEIGARRSVQKMRPVRGAESPPQRQRSPDADDAPRSTKRKLFTKPVVEKKRKVPLPKLGDRRRASKNVPPAVSSDTDVGEEPPQLVVADLSQITVNSKSASDDESDEDEEDTRVGELSP